MRALVLILAIAAPAAAQTTASVPASELWERDLRAAVAACWNAAALDPEAAAAQVTVRVTFDRAARPLADSIALIGATDGNPAAAERLYQSARRAILRCGRTGYSLPPETFALWQDMEFLFDPENAP